MKIWGALLLLAALGASEQRATALDFEPNRGQANPAARYVARGGSHALRIEDGAIVFVSSSSGGSLRLEFEGASPQAAWNELEPNRGTTSYVIGRDRSRWLLDVPHYNRIVRKNLYPGVDLAVYGGEDRLEYDLILAAGADPKRIQFHFRGEGSLILDANGDLKLPIGGGALTQRKPRLFQ